jgi:hypothetical protein
MVAMRWLRGEMRMLGGSEWMDGCHLEAVWWMLPIENRRSQVA